jgi:hypothetical protein
MGHVDHRVDLRSMPFEDASYDLVYRIDEFHSLLTNVHISEKEYLIIDVTLPSSSIRYLRSVTGLEDRPNCLEIAITCQVLPSHSTMSPTSIEPTS